MFKTGERVVSLGDRWMGAGAKGVIHSVSEIRGSALVHWYLSPKALKTHKHLSHKFDALAYDDNILNPNLAFRMKKGPK